MADEKLEMTPHGKHFLLRQTDASGAVSEITLTPQSVLVLVQSSRRLMDQILAARNTEEVKTDVHMPVAQVRLSVDLHKSDVLIGMIDSVGAEERFSLPLEVAKPLAERLPARVAEIEAAILNKTVQ